MRQPPNKSRAALVARPAESENGRDSAASIVPSSKSVNPKHSQTAKRHFPFCVTLYQAAAILGVRFNAYVEYDYGSSDWGEKTDWRLESAPERQPEVLSNFGVNTRESDLNRGNASQLLDALIRRARKGLASVDKVLWLHKHGAKNAERLTKGEAHTLCELFAEEGPGAMKPPQVVGCANMEDLP